jgi:prepilin-type N-terminal cleavage/methylation domain-containing protein
LNDKGFTLFEIVITIFVVGIAIAPMAKAFRPAVFSVGSEEKTIVFANQVRGTLSRVVALDFDTLNNNQGDPVDLTSLFGSAEQAGKETFMLKGQSYMPTVAINDAGGGSGGLLEIIVKVEGLSLKTVKAAF